LPSLGGLCGIQDHSGDNVVEGFYVEDDVDSVGPRTSIMKVKDVSIGLGGE